jgi:hypothetical protein
MISTTTPEASMGGEVIAHRPAAQAPAANILPPSHSFSIFETCKSQTPSGQTHLKEFLRGVRDGAWRGRVENCRIVLRTGEKADYKELRESLIQAVSLSISCATRGEDATPEEKQEVHSGLLQIDVDSKDHPGMDLEELRRIVQEAPFIVACFLSLSGNGIKGIARIPADFDSHAGCFEAARLYFEERGIQLDANTKDKGRLCFASYDSALFYNKGAKELQPVPIPERDYYPSQANSMGTEDPEHVRRVLAKVAAKIGPAQKRSTWLHLCGATQDAVGPDAAGDIVDDFFPPQAEGDQSACDVLPLKGDWNWSSIWKYGVDPVDHVRDMPDVEEEGELSTGKPSLRERAYALRFDPNETPPPDETCMMIGDVPIAARGNLTVIQGKSKVGKSAVVSAILGAAQRGDFQNSADTLCMSWKGEGTGAIVHLDTEQSRADWHGLVSRGVTRSGLPEVSPRLISLPLVMFTRSERLEVLRETLEYEQATRGKIDAVIIDGIADLCISPNDEAEALELVSWVMAKSQVFNTPVYCVLHENPGSDQGKTRGHLGSELNRKAFANLRIDKDTETSVSTIYGMDMRKRDIPKEQGFCFAWNDTAKMHTFQGRAAGMKAANAKEKALAKARTEWEGIFEAAEIGTNEKCPGLTPEQAAEALRDITGTAKPVTIDAMKKRMQRAESLGVLRKTGTGGWTLNPSGQSGQVRDI